MGFGENILRKENQVYADNGFFCVVELITNRIATRIIIMPTALFQVMGSCKNTKAKIEANTGFIKKTLDPAVVFNLDKPLKKAK